MMMTRQGMVLSAVLGVLAVFSVARLYQAPVLADASGTSFKSFPTVVGKWKSIGEYPPGKKEVELLETSNILTRLYRDDRGREVTMVLVYDPSGNRKMAHPQEICLTAGGMLTIKKNSAPLAGTDLEVERLLMQKDTRRTLYYYWYKAGPYHSGNYLKSQFRLALSALTGGSGGTALVRLSGVLKTPGEEAQVEEALQDFARDVMADVDSHLK